MKAMRAVVRFNNRYRRLANKKYASAEKSTTPLLLFE